MEFKKAIFFHNYLKIACETFYVIIENKTLGGAQINGNIVPFTDEEFDRYYHDFKSELRLNSIEIQDIEIIFEYVCYNFSDILSWAGFEKNIKQLMVSNQFEIKYLMQLKENIEYHVGKIKEMGTRDKFGDINEDFEDRIQWYINHPEEENDDLLFDRKTKILSDFDLKNFINDEYYTFIDVQLESEKLESLVERINFLEDRLKSYRQIIIKKKKDIIEKALLAQDKDFEKLCVIEIESLHRKLELELKTNKHSFNSGAENKPDKDLSGNLIWKATGTDLLELLAALHKSESIQRKGGKPLTRKELIEYFQVLFGVEIKDVEGSLTRATGRKINMTPFLDRLKVAFENYAVEKEGKLQKRK